MTDVDSYKGKKKHGFFHKIKELKHKHDEPKMEISGPTDFKHESHIGWDEKNGFEIKNIPPEWRQLFQQAGIKKKDLKNPDTVQFIYSVIGENINNQKMGGSISTNNATSNINTAGSAGGVLPPSQRARAPPPPPPGGSKVQTARAPPPKPGSEIRQLPQKHYQAQISKPLPPQPGQSKQMAQQQPPGQYQQQRKPSNPPQPQVPVATNVRGNLPTTIGGKPIPVTMIKPGGDTFVTSPTSRQAPSQTQQYQPPQQQFNNNEPLIQQEVKTQYVLDEPLQPTLKRMPQQAAPQINNQQNVSSTLNADGSQTFTFKPQSDSTHQYTYQSSSQQQGYNNYYSVQSPQPPIQQQQQKVQQPTIQQPPIQQQHPQFPPIPVRKLPTPGQQRKPQSPPPIPTSKRPPVQQPIKNATTSPTTRVQPPIIQRSQAQTQIPAVTVTDKFNEPINDDLPPPPPPMPQSIAQIVPEHVDPKSPLPPPPKNSGLASIPPVSLESPVTNTTSVPSAPPPPPSIKTPIASPPSTKILNDNIPPQTDARSNLMDSIRNFGGSNHLKKVDPSEPLPDLKELQLGEEGNRSLVDTLAAAMAQRRGNLGEDDDDDDEDSDWDC